MDKKQLDFNAPFLSVRRLSTAAVYPVAKDNEKSKLNRRQSLPIKKSVWELEDVTKPAAVPFQWEHIPGRAKDEKGSTPHTPKRPFSNSPKTPPGRQMDIAQQILEEDLEKLYSSGPRIGASPLNEDRNDRKVYHLESEEEEDDAYSDELESLSSPTQSFSWRCSDSGLSGIDDLGKKSSKKFGTDPQTQDYMMSRFLPAAKAMILETPQYVSKKPAPVIEQPPVYVKKVYSGELRPLLEKYRSNPVSPYNQTVKKEEKEGKDDGTKKKSGKAFGFFPRSCIKKSLSLFLNPMPSLKPKPQAQPKPPISSSGELKRMARTSYSGPITPTFDKHTSEAVYRKRPVFRSREFLIDNNLTGKANQFYHSGEILMRNGPSAIRGSTGGRSISPYRNEMPRSPFHDGAAFLGVPKFIPNVDATKKSPIYKNDKGSDKVTPVAEKTVYIDSVTKVEAPRSSLSSKTFGPLKNRKNTSKLNAGNMARPKAFGSRPKAFGSFDVVPPSDHGTNLKNRGYRNLGLKVDQKFEDDVRSFERAIVALNEDIDETMKGDYGQRGMIPQSPVLAPPLPKSPSESWLWRTVSLRNPFLKKQVQKTSMDDDAKWEIIVKASNVHHDHVRYSEELLPHVSQLSKS